MSAYRVDLAIPFERLQREALAIPRHDPAWEPGEVLMDAFVWPVHWMSMDASRLPVAREVAALIPGATIDVSLKRLGPNSILPRHRDADAVLRYHVPIVTHERCVFIVWDGQHQPHEIATEEGGVWVLDPRLEHMVVNGSRQDRIHLVVEKAAP